MSSGSFLKNFEDFLEPEFNSTQFTNDLLKAINNTSDSDVLDLKTPIKKCTYDIQELDKRIEELIKRSPSSIIDQLHKKTSEKAMVNENLRSSMKYLSMSYKRLQEDVLEPYEHALKLQTVSGKIHQTSNLMRSALIYLYLLSQMKEFEIQSGPESNERLASGLKIAAIHTQIMMTLEDNPDLKILQLIRKCENEIVAPKRQELLFFLSAEISKWFLNKEKDVTNAKLIQSLIKSLHALSPQDFSTCIDKILTANIQNSEKVLAKIITSIRNFRLAMDDVIENRNSVFYLQTVLSESGENDISLLKEYLLSRRQKSILDYYWSKVSSSFRAEFETSFTRGGPVGKSLIKNSELIKNTIAECMPKDTKDQPIQNEMNYMVNAVGILTKGPK